MICRRCGEQLIATAGTITGYAHDHGAADHPAEPTIGCVRCGGGGHVDTVAHGVACRVRGCGPDAGCVTTVLACPDCERAQLGDDLDWSAAGAVQVDLDPGPPPWRLHPVPAPVPSRPSAADAVWAWLARVVVPPGVLAMPAQSGATPLSFFGLRRNDTEVVTWA